MVANGLTALAGLMPYFRSILEDAIMQNLTSNLVKCHQRHFFVISKFLLLLRFYSRTICTILTIEYP